MANPVDNKVLTFTPIVSSEYGCITEVTGYLRPWSGVVALHIPGSENPDGSLGALRVRYHRKWYETALMIASYILTCGIAPLLAAIATVIIRCYHKFHWIQYAGPVIDFEQMRQNPAGMLAAHPELVPEFVRIAARAQPEIAEAYARLGDLREAIGGLEVLVEDPRFFQAAMQNLAPAFPGEPRLANRPGGNRLGGVNREADPRVLAAEAAERRLRRRAAG